MREEDNTLGLLLVNTVRSFSLGFFMVVRGEMHKIPFPSFSGFLIFGFLLLSRAPQQCQGMSAEPAAQREVSPEQSLSC